MAKSFHQAWQKTNPSRVRFTAFHILLVTVALGSVLLVFEFTLLGRLGGNGGTNPVFYPDEIYESEAARPVPEEDLMHLALLHEACMTHKESVIPWTYGLGGKVATPSTILNKDDPDLLEKMRKCPDVDIFLPLGLRGNGYCEDAIGYTKYLETRMLPRWAIEMKYEDKETGESFTYHDLCPKTPMIFMNHYWDGIPNKPEWPKDKQLYMMPNIEMHELRAEHYWGVHAVLCKTAICAQRVRMWYTQEGNPNNTVVWYTRHTSSDITTLAKWRLGADAIKPKDFSNVKFIHAVGTSVQKGTQFVLGCWLKRPDLPKLDVYVDQHIFDTQYKKYFGERINKTNGQVTIHGGRVPANEFGKLMAESAFALCTSTQEGYGHYINQARASGSLILAVDLPPMNELLSPQSAVLVKVPLKDVQEQLLGGRFNGEHGLKGVDPIQGDLERYQVCEGVDRILQLSVQEREAMAKRARIQYYIDTNFFATKMMELRVYARTGKRSIRDGDFQP